MDYWEETISEAFEDAGIAATKEQIQTVASWVEGAHDNYGMAHGYDAIPSHVNSEIEQIKARHAAEIAELQKQVNCYRDSVALRRGVKREDVYLDSNGCVMYG